MTSDYKGMLFMYFMAMRNFIGPLKLVGKGDA